MGDRTAIAWTDHTFNPWWGCTRVSPGCEHCYAETWAKRTGNRLWGPTGARRFFSEKHWREPLRWNARAQKEGIRRRVFCASMADVFEDRADLLPHRARLWKLLRETPWLDWQILTKRPENIGRLAYHFDWQWWLGVSVENRATLHRIDTLRQVPAAVRFVSFEPLLEDLGALDLSGIHWAILGGESGPGARPCDVAWIRDGLRQCREAGVAAFVKQLGRWARLIDPDRAAWHEQWKLARDITYDGDAFYVELKNRKGADPAEWPSDLRVQEFPR